MALNFKGVTQKQEQAQQQLQEAQQKVQKLTSQSEGTITCNGVTKPLSITETMAVVELASLKASLDGMKDQEKAFESVRKDLMGLANDGDFPANQQVVLTADAAEVIFKSASKKRVIVDKHGLIGALKKKVGYEALLAMLSISLSDVDKYLSALESKQFIDEVEGSRTLGSAVLKD